MTAGTLHPRTGTPCVVHERFIPTTHGRLRAQGGDEKNRWEGDHDMAVVTMKQLLEAGVHFGHQTRRWDPRMQRFIHGERSGIVHY